MPGKRRKREILNRTDHRLDMSPAGRNLFVSRDKQLQSRAARRLKLWTRVVLGALITAAAAVGIFLFLLYLGPWFRSEISVGTASGQSSSEAPAVTSDVQQYDSMGLPIYSESVSLFAVNANSPAQPDFVPELTEVGNAKVDSRIASPLRQLVAAAKQDGLALDFKEGYVSYQEQESRFEAKAEELAEAQGLSTVMARAQAASLEPKPGECDSQSGMCVRLDADPETFDTSRTYSWLKQNMGRYGFVYRYPQYKEDVTGVKYDPTVIRYVGSASAVAMQQRSLCLEEYISYLNSQ